MCHSYIVKILYYCYFYSIVNNAEENIFMDKSWTALLIIFIGLEWNDCYGDFFLYFKIQKSELHNHCTHTPKFTVSRPVFYIIKYDK